MKDIANDLAHIFFVILVLWLSSLGWVWCMLSGFFIGWLVELKEEDSNVLRWESWGHIGIRDLIGYTIGGLAIGLLLYGCHYHF